MDSQAEQKLVFPDGFFWGAATSAHQIEGWNSNDWSEWEWRNVDEMAEEYEARYRLKEKIGLKFPKWPGFRRQASQKKNYLSGAAAASYQMWRQDIDLLTKLNLNSYRFSIEWSRIEPEYGRWRKSALDHYERIVDTLLERGIEPIVTLWHYSLPKWFYHQGGWLRGDAYRKFCEYVEKVVTRLKGKVRYWITMNEPVIYLNSGYLVGEFPPGKTDLFEYIRMFGHLERAHREAYQQIKAIDDDAQVGLAQNVVYFEAYKNRLFNKLLKSVLDYWYNFRFLNATQDYNDFLGLNYYFHNRIDYGVNKNDYELVNDMGWEIYPEGIYHVLKALSRYKKPIIVTENGVPDRKDQYREDFIRRHLLWVHKALEEGVDVRGYLHWSLIDNFEWADGFWPRFGLVEVDYRTKQRIIRPSAREYAQIAQENSVVV